VKNAETFLEDAIDAANENPHSAKTISKAQPIIILHAMYKVYREEQGMVRHARSIKRSAWVAHLINRRRKQSMLQTPVSEIE
jgi:hypothetical protein